MNVRLENRLYIYRYEIGGWSERRSFYFYFLFLYSLFPPSSLFSTVIVHSLWRIKRHESSDWEGHEMTLAFSRVGICQILSSEARVEIYNSRNATERRNGAYVWFHFHSSRVSLRISNGRRKNIHLNVANVTWRNLLTTLLRTNTVGLVHDGPRWVTFIV